MYMTYYVTITSQGQMSIPASIRRQFRLDTIRKAKVEVRDGGIMIKPIKDILDLQGVFKTKKRVPFKKAREAFETYLATRHLNDDDV